MTQRGRTNSRKSPYRLSRVGLGTFILKGGDEPVGRNSVLSNAPFLACLVSPLCLRVIETDCVLVTI